jgi:hydroxymethylpyrimidine/phosphomethylpyrimidine kinase
MLANGLDAPDAVREAQEYTWKTLQKAYRPGMGQFLPDRLFWAREGDEVRGEEPADAGHRIDARGTH